MDVSGRRRSGCAAHQGRARRRSRGRSRAGIHRRVIPVTLLPRPTGYAFLHRWPERPADLGGSSCRTTARNPRPNPSPSSRPTRRMRRGRSPIPRTAAGSSNGRGATSRTDVLAFRSNAEGRNPLFRDTTRTPPIAVADAGFRSRFMATDAEIEAAVRSMRAIRTSGGKVSDEVLRAYARAALQAAELAQVAEYWRRAELRAHTAIQAAAN